MISYYSTCISGLQDLARQSLLEKISDVVIESVFDGLLVYKTSKLPQKVIELPFFNNNFLLLDLQSREVKSLNRFIRSFLSKNDLRILSKLNLKKGSFRIITSQENQLVSIKPSLMSAAERYFVRKLSWSVNRAKPDYEVWFLKRREGVNLVGLRISRSRSLRKLSPGELKPQLAFFLCFLADIEKDDTILDPFSGYGSVVSACLKYFSPKQIIAIEKKQWLSELLRKKFSRQNKVIVKKDDSLKMNFLAKHSIDKIITDPPWGFYQKNKIDPANFYFQMLKQFQFLLKPGGIAVVLTGQKQVFERLLKKFAYFSLCWQYQILVSGKKAGLYQLKAKK